MSSICTPVSTDDPPTFETLLAELYRRSIRLHYLSQRPPSDLSGGATEHEPWLCCVANEYGNGWSRGPTALAAISAALSAYVLYPRPENLTIVRRAVAAEPRIARRATAEDLDLL